MLLVKEQILVHEKGILTQISASKIRHDIAFKHHPIKKDETIGSQVKKPKPKKPSGRITNVVKGMAMIFVNNWTWETILK